MEYRNTLATLNLATSRLPVKQNVKEQATLSARASVDYGVKVETKREYLNGATDRGCCISTGSAGICAFGLVATTQRRNLTPKLRPKNSNMPPITTTHQVAWPSFLF